MARALPGGRVTFAFVDVVESTKTFAAYGDAFVQALAVLHDRIARHTVSMAGAVVKTEGDGAFLAFPTADAAVGALVALQEELSRVPPEVVPRLTVRAGAHTGDAMPVADDYVALAVNVAARVTSTAGAGQVVISAATHGDLADRSGACVGDYDLKDVADPVELWRMCGDETPLRGSPSRRTNVRIPATSFIGREVELHELSYLLDEHRLLTVLGPGGLGKTRLGSELVLEIAGGIEGGAWMVELASLQTADQLPSAVGQALGVPASDVAPIATELRRRGSVLLVLDNCEHLIDAVADLVVDLQEAAPEVRLLCTSREALDVPGEHIWRLPPLDGKASRIELFTQRAWASGADVPDDSAAMVERLCDALDGLPLAIELAASHSGSTTLTELVQIAEHGSDDLARRGGQSRQRSLDAVLTWSLDRLPPVRRAALLALSILPGRFDGAMATAFLEKVEGCEAGAVRPLARASLLDLDGESYRILDTIKHAARRSLANDPDLAAAARRGLRAWAYDRAADGFRVAKHWEDVPAGEALALEAALEQGMDDGAGGLGQLWERIKMLAYAREPSERVLALAQRQVSGRLPADADEALCIASALSVLGLVDQRTVPFERREAICEAADRHGIYFAQANLHFGMVFDCADVGDVDGARRHTEGYLPYAESPAAHPIERRAIHSLRSLVAYADGDFEASLLHAEMELLEARAFENDIDLDVCEGNYAQALLQVGRAADALPHAVEAVRLCPIAGPHRRSMLRTLARAQAGIGDHGAAAATLREIEAELVASGRSAEQVTAELVQLTAEVPGPEDRTAAGGDDRSS